MIFDYDYNGVRYVRFVYIPTNTMYLMMIDRLFA